MYFWKDAASYCVNASKSIKLSELPHKFKQMIAIDLFKSMQVYGCLKKKMLLIKKIIDEDRRSSFTLVNNNNRNGINATKGYLVNNEKEFCIMINLIDIELRGRDSKFTAMISNHFRISSTHLKRVGKNSGYFSQ